MAAELNPNLNKEKQNDILDLWYLLTGEKFGKVNLDTNEEFRDALPSGTREYINAIKKQDVELVSKQEIVVDGDKNLQLVFLHDFNLYDLENPQKGVEDKTSFKAINQALQNKDKNDKSVVIIDGDVIGKEYTISKLANASIEDKHILFWGVQIRVKKLIDYLTYLAERGPDEIILMNGRDEHLIKNKLNRDVLNDALLDKFNKILLEYAVEIAKHKGDIKSSKKVQISYVPGVKKVFNVKKIVDGKNYFYDFSVHTNLRSTCDSLKGVSKAAEKQHAGLAIADQIFVASENAVGNLDGVVYTSGLARYKDSTRGSLSAPSTKGYNCFTMILKNENHQTELIRSPNFTNIKTHGIEMKIAEEKAKANYLVALCRHKIAEQLSCLHEQANNTNYREIYLNVKLPNTKTKSVDKGNDQNGG